jgi:hypothetical protein
MSKNPAGLNPAAARPKTAPGRKLTLVTTCATPACCLRPFPIPLLSAEALADSVFWHFSSLLSQFPLLPANSLYLTPYAEPVNLFFHFFLRPRNKPLTPPRPSRGMSPDLAGTVAALTVREPRSAWPGCTSK